MTIFTPEQFNAVGDGVTDDYPALQKAVFEAHKAFGVVELGANAYLTRTPINVYDGRFTIRGVGYQTTSVASYTFAGSATDSNDYTKSTTGSRIIARECAAFTRDDGSSATEAHYLRVEHLAIIGTGDNAKLAAFNFAFDQSDPSNSKVFQTATTFNQFIDVGVFRFGTGHDSSLHYGSVWRDCRANGCLVGFRLGWDTSSTICKDKAPPTPRSRATPAATRIESRTSISMRVINASCSSRAPASSSIASWPSRTRPSSWCFNRRAITDFTTFRCAARTWRPTHPATARM